MNSQINKIKIKLRSINETDFPVLLEMIQEFASYLEQPNSVATNLSMLHEGKDTFTCFFIEDEKEKVIGYAFTYIVFHTWTGKTLYLEDIYIREQYRGASVGSLVMEELINYAKQIKCTRMDWQVLKINYKAIAFYERLKADIDDGKLDCSVKIK